MSDIYKQSSSVQKVRAALIEKEVPEAAERIISLPESSPTAVAAARQIACEVGAIVNSLIFEANGNPVLILTSGAHRVNTSHVANLLGVASLTRATPEFVKEKTGQVIGGVAPVGHPEPIATYIDQELANYQEIWAAAGHPHTVFPITFEKLVEVTGASVIRVN